MNKSKKPVHSLKSDIIFSIFASLPAILFLAVGAMLILTAAKSYKRSSKSENLPMLIYPENSPVKYPPIIRLHDLKTGSFFCSGTVIAANYAVTAGHCLADRSTKKPSISIRTLKNEVTPITATAIFYEERSDQGLIYGDFSDFNAMSFDVKPVEEITYFLNQEVPVIACGFPYGGDLFCTTLTDRRQAFFQIAGMGVLYPGMSGGPVLCPINGEGMILGVNTAVLENGILISPLVELLNHAHISVEGSGK